jgi:uncharacterized protein YjbI with pentapeptide repeats
LGYAYLAVATLIGEEFQNAEVLLRGKDYDMKEIRDRFTGQLLWQTEARTLQGTNLAGRNLSRANLSYEDLSGANLAGALLVDALLDSADLTNADLRGSWLTDTTFRSVVFTNTKVAGARLSNATFASCPSLYEADGLDQVVFGPQSCTFDLPTLTANFAKLFNTSMSFLYKLGLTSDQIETLIRIFPDVARRQYSSAFLSYARADNDFAERLYNDLVSHNIRCFKDTHDLALGEFWLGSLEQAIREYDKLIVICSASSLVRPSVAEEILLALESETTGPKLLPIAIDDFIATVAPEDVLQHMPRPQRRLDWVTRLKHIEIGNFIGWQTNYSVYTASLSRLLKALGGDLKP